jgi:hypothetical protein
MLKLRLHNSLNQGHGVAALKAGGRLENRGAFEQMYAKLIETHRGDWVAIAGAKLIDYDKQKEALVKRIANRPNRDSIFVEKVIPRHIVGSSHFSFIAGQPGNHQSREKKKSR